VFPVKERLNLYILFRINLVLREIICISVLTPPVHPCQQSGFVLAFLPIKIMYAFLFSSMDALFPSYLCLFYLIIMKICVELYKL
jgi:hypothetical protein